MAGAEGSDRDTGTESGMPTLRCGYNRMIAPPAPVLHALEPRCAGQVVSGGSDRRCAACIPGGAAVICEVRRSCCGSTSQLLRYVPVGSTEDLRRVDRRRRYPPLGCVHQCALLQSQCGIRFRQDSPRAVGVRDLIVAATVQVRTAGHAIRARKAKRAGNDSGRMLILKAHESLDQK